MRTIIKFFKNSYEKVLRSIAFYPVIISLGFLILALGGMRMDHLEVISALKENVPYLFIQDYDTAKSILSTLIGGILSLTVFSFSMVMVVLNQASSNFSPRLLPDLISNKRHQIILGIYIGTLLYCIIILMALGAYGVDKSSLGLSTMLAAAMGVVCTGIFVYFINTISKAIQIQNIIDRIFSSSHSYLTREIDNTSFKAADAINEIETDDWTVINATKTGYFRGFDGSLLKSSIEEQDNVIYVLPYINRHVWAGHPILKIKNKVSKEERENLLFCITTSSDRHEGDKGIGGMIKLMEIAVKAMSPGINDPGTAIDVIVKLGQLIKEFLHFPPFTIDRRHDEACMIVRNVIPASELMRLLMQPLRLYSKQDSSVCHTLIEVLQYIIEDHKIDSVKKAPVIQELNALQEDIKSSIANSADRERLLGLID